MLSEQHRNELASDFHSYFTGAIKDCDNKVAINDFIVKNSDDEVFTRKINSVEQGFFIYTARCHSSDLANPEPWCNLVVSKFSSYISNMTPPFDMNTTN